MVIQGHLETWLAGCLQADEEGFPVAAFIEQDFRKYLECGILAHGFARAKHDGCGYDLLIAFSCKERGNCPSCDNQLMVETAAQLVDKVFTQIHAAVGVVFPQTITVFP